jgi:hypothetical protein
MRQASNSPWLPSERKLFDQEIKWEQRQLHLSQKRAVLLLKRSERSAKRNRGRQRNIYQPSPDIPNL